MPKYKIKRLKVLKKIFWSFYQNILQKNGTLPKWFFIYQQLDKWQNEYYPDNLNLIRFCSRISFHVLMVLISLLKWNLGLYWKWQTFEVKIWLFFRTSKNRYLFLIFANKETLFPEQYKDGIKNILHNIWRILQIAKIKHCNSNF